MAKASSHRASRLSLALLSGVILGGLLPDCAPAVASPAAGREAVLLLHPLLGQAAQPAAIEADLLADAADGSLDRYSGLAAALVAGGLEDPAKLRWYEGRVADLVDELRGSGQASGSPLDRARVVFEFMHARVLCGGYAIDCTDPSVALDEGRFNCVSASVLYCHLGAQFGLDIRGLEQPGHVMSRLVLRDETLDIETTCRQWGRAVRGRAPSSAPGLVTLGTSGATAGLPRSAGNTAKPACREVAGPALIATVYYNRGLDLLNRGDFARAVVANLRAVELDPDNRTARGNLLASLNNWAVHEGSRRHYAEAVDLLGAGLAIEPSFKTFAANYVHVHRQWASMLQASGRWAEAASLLQRAASDPRLAGRLSP